MKAKTNMTMLCDFYELTMGNGYFQTGLTDRICYFDVFYRSVPDQGGFAIAAGLAQVVEYIENLHFDEEDIAYLRSKDCFAEEFLDYLKENNIPRTIATMSEKDNVDFYITEFNLAQWFDLDKIVYSDGTISGKPAPDIYIIAANKLGLKPENCIVIEDAISGINSAKSAGIGKVVAIASMEKPEFYEPLGVDEIITDFKNYTEILKIKEMLF